GRRRWQVRRARPRRRNGTAAAIRARREDQLPPLDKALLNGVRWRPLPDSIVVIDHAVTRGHAPSHPASFWAAAALAAARLHGARTRSPRRPRADAALPLTESGQLDSLGSAR